jgi:hypothetical protein
MVTIQLNYSEAGVDSSKLGGTKNTVPGQKVWWRERVLVTGKRVAGRPFVEESHNYPFVCRANFRHTLHT